jgi:hypothetical protein
MGLDLYLYRINKIDKNRPEETYAEYLYDDKFCKTILKNSKKVIVNNSQYDTNKLLKDNGVTMDNISCTSGDQFGYTYNFKNGYQFNISWEELEKYKVFKKEKMLRFIQDKICYQRKGINDKGWKILEKIGNCVYCDDKKLIKNLTKYGLNKEFIEKWIDGKTVFMAWW